MSIVGTGDETSVIAIDDDYAARRATEHLIALGHTRIAFIGGGTGTHWASVDRQRLSGYESAMAEAGLDGEARHVRSEVSMPAGYQAAVDLLGDARLRPTALVAVSDEVAVGAIIAARRLGILDHPCAEAVGDSRQFGGAIPVLQIDERHARDPQDRSPIEQ